MSCWLNQAKGKWIRISHLNALEFLISKGFLVKGEMYFLYFFIDILSYSALILKAIGCSSLGFSKRDLRLVLFFLHFALKVIEIRNWSAEAFRFTRWEFLLHCLIDAFLNQNWKTISHEMSDTNDISSKYVKNVVGHFFLVCVRCNVHSLFINIFINLDDKIIVFCQKQNVILILYIILFNINVIFCIYF